VAARPLAFGAMIATGLAGGTSVLLLLSPAFTRITA